MADYPNYAHVVDEELVSVKEEQATIERLLDSLDDATRQVNDSIKHRDTIRQTLISRFDVARERTEKMDAYYSELMHPKAQQGERAQF